MESTATKPAIVAKDEQAAALIAEAMQARPKNFGIWPDLDNSRGRNEIFRYATGEEAAMAAHEKLLSNPTQTFYVIRRTAVVRSVPSVEEIK